MSNYSNMMRTMRKYSYDAQQIQRKKNKEQRRLERYKGSSYYDEELEKLNTSTQNSLAYTREKVQEELKDLFTNMRANVEKRATKAPTQDMAATLSILGQLENVSVSQMNMYAKNMSDCPLALQLLDQIGSKHNVRINVPDSESMLRSVDVLEWNTLNYLNNYIGAEDPMSASMESLKPYFQTEEAFLDMPNVRTVENADADFWRRFVQFGEPSMLEDPNTAGTPAKAEHVFSNFDGMLKYMDKQTDGMSDNEKQDKINEILANSPETYGAAYRNYLATGVKTPIHQSIDETFEQFLSGEPVEA